jgi:hypothetical protein
MKKATVPMRVWFAFMGSVLWVGIYLTGFSAASWVSYLPTAGFTFAAATGYCPSQSAIFGLFRAKQK